MVNYLKRFNILLLSSAIFSALPGMIQGQTVEIGPYVQFTGANSAIVRWQTDIPCDSIMEYGTSSKKLDLRLAEKKMVKKHELAINNLLQNTKYYYRVGSTTAAGEKFTQVYWPQEQWHINDCGFDNGLNYSQADCSQAVSPYKTDSLTKLYEKTADHIIGQTKITAGYCLIYGCGQGRLAFELAKRTQLTIIGVDTDGQKIYQARDKLRQAGVYGSRVTVRTVDSLAKLPFTDNLANLIVSDSIITNSQIPGSATEIMRLLRPGGGIAYLGSPIEIPAKLKKSTLENWTRPSKQKWDITSSINGTWAKITRPPLPGIGEWTHQYGEPGNSACSGDTLGGATSTGDLQVQWIGQPGADFGIDRNPRMPAPLATNGRLFHQGFNRMLAMDGYNGAILWSLEIPHLRRVNIPRDSSNWCADKTSLFVAIKDKCWIINGTDGTLTDSRSLPEQYKPTDYDWGYIAQTDSVIYGSAVKKEAIYSAFWGKDKWYDGRSGKGTEKVCSECLFAYKKDIPTKIWQYNNGIIINPTITIGGGRVYFIESRNAEVKALKTGRIGSKKLWLEQYLVALDSGTGKKNWEQHIDTADGYAVFYLSYANNTLIIESSVASEYHFYARNATTGKPLWQAKHKWTASDHSGHMQHPVIVGDTVYAEPHSYDLLTGKRTNNNMDRHVGCATYAAGKDAFVYRGQSRCVAIWDIAQNKVTKWPNLRSSCWISVIPAGGMILSPEGGGGCSCGNWLETSLGFAPKPASGQAK